MEKKPYVVEIEYVEILQAVNKPVLSKVVLRIGGTTEMPPPPPGTFVRPEPSPTNLA